LFCRNIEGLQILLFLTAFANQSATQFAVQYIGYFRRLSIACNWCLISATLMEVVSPPEIEEESLMADTSVK